MLIVSPAAAAAIAPAMVFWQLPAPVALTQMVAALRGIPVAVMATKARSFVKWFCFIVCWYPPITFFECSTVYTCNVGLTETKAGFRNQYFRVGKQAGRAQRAGLQS